MIQPIILCGGRGSRLWPVSRTAWPKQFARVTGDATLYQSTLARMSGADFAPPIVLTAKDLRFVASDQAEDVGCAARVVVEPAPRDTAAAVLVAALLHEDQPDTVLCLAPSDHVIQNADAFHTALRRGAKAAADGALVCFGVAPIRPETAYGYLDIDPMSDGLHPVRAFVEKPDAQTAETLVAAGHLWNAGLFMATAGQLIAAFEAHAPDLVAPCRTAVDARHEDLGIVRLGAAFAAARSLSFDYAIMEKAETVVAIPLDAGWCDLGAWDAVWRTSTNDEAGVASGPRSHALDCRDTLLRSDPDGPHLVGVGLTDIVAVATRDAVLVADRRRAQDVKTAVTLLREAGVAEADQSLTVHRPWGQFERICHGPRFQVKRIVVRPGGILSLQSHLHRSEHWVVVEGTAEVTIGTEVRLLSENESVYVPLGARHRLANPGRLPLTLIEVQTGAYLGEDDITRYEDVYARETTQSGDRSAQPAKIFSSATTT